MRLLLFVFCCVLALPTLADEPEMWVKTRIAPTTDAVVGGEVRLEVDVLVNTWFTSAPQLPALNLPNAQVSPPSSEATHLNEKHDGQTFFGLRFVYLITPNEAQRYDIPALSIRVTTGPDNQQLTVQSQPVSFSATLPAGVSAGQQLLVAQGLTLSQTIEKSATALQVGDSITRTLTLQANGVQSMRLPAPALTEVEGLKRYLNAAQISTLDDGRGNVSGGQRIDSVTYVVERAGNYSLPPITLQWWDSSASQMRSSEVPAVTFSAKPNSTYKAHFSIAADLQRLGQKSRLHLSRHWLGLVVLLLGTCVLVYCARPWWPRLVAALKARRIARRQRWLNSAEYAWKQAGAQLDSQPPQLDALYLWARRSAGNVSLQAFISRFDITSVNPLLTFFKSRYGQESLQADNVPELKQIFCKLHKIQPQDNAANQCLQPLNPRRSNHAKDSR